jgi:hypothetical protein
MALRKFWTTALISGSLLFIPNMSHAYCSHQIQGLGHWFVSGLGLFLLGGPLVMVWLWLRGGKQESEDLPPARKIGHWTRLQGETQDALRAIKTEYVKTGVDRIHGRASRRTAPRNPARLRAEVTC